MNNLFTLTAQIAQAGEVRYTPAGVPVLDMVLKHESWQQENGQQCLVKFEMPAKIIGKEALQWQHGQNMMVEITGFLAQRSQRYTRPVLRIQNIQEYKG